MRTYETVVTGLVASLSFLGTASAASIETRQSCPQIHVFGARETTVSPGYGSAGTLVNAILSAFPGSTAEAITYPACGGQSSCGGIAYGDSVRAGTQAVTTAINNFNQRCPNTKIAVVGYSQGGQIFDNAFCGGADSGAGINNNASPLTASAHAAVQAVILYGNPRYRAGLPYNVGTCTAQGFAARPAGFTCYNNGGSRIKNYCDSPDPYCCNGNNQQVHQGYQGVYGQQALAFVRERLNASGNPPTTTPSPPGTTVTPPPTNTPGPGCSALWGQCGGQGWTGPTCCSQGTCRAQNAWYSQCLN